MDCLTNIVGISDTNCECWDDTKPVDFATVNASSSGLFVLSSDVVPIHMANAATSCGTGSIWDLAIKARDRAIYDFIGDFTNRILKRQANRFVPFDVIGDPYRNGSNALFSTNNVAGVCFEPYMVKGGVLTINSVDIGFLTGINSAQTLDVRVYSSLHPDDSIGQTTVTVSQNKEVVKAVFATPIVLDLADVRRDLNEKIFVVYDVPAGARPYANKTKKGCGCGGRSEALDNPFLYVMCDVKGIEASSFTTLDRVRSNGSAYGMTINVTFQCDFLDWLCELSVNPKIPTVGGNINLGIALTQAIDARAKMYLMDSILKSQRINYYTMVLDDSILITEIQAQQGRYEQAMANLTYYMPKDVNNCLVCRESRSFKKSTIKI